MDTDLPYAGERIIHDADAHIMELPDTLQQFADPDIRARMVEMDGVPLVGNMGVDFERLTHKHGSDDYRERERAELMTRKNWHATGSYLKEDRPRVLDMLGFRSQLMFNTFGSAYLVALEHGDDVELTYGVATAHNRAMADFCAVDSRLLAVGYVPLMEFERAAACASEALELGCRALMIPSACPRDHSPSHLKLFPVWERAQEAGVPIVMHVGGGGRLLSPRYFANGLPMVKDFHGGAENFRSVDYMAIPGPPMQSLATMIIDGISERFPNLKLGVIEQGAIWVPSFMRQLDAAFEAFRRHEERLQKLSLKPSEYVTRQVRVTPYPTEDTGWVIREAGEEICLFSSDYPHVEGGRNPLKRFDESIAGLSEQARQRFYCDNFLDLMGGAVR